jgi:hypothetical protein
MEFGTIIFAIWQIAHWARTRAAVKKQDAMARIEADASSRVASRRRRTRRDTLKNALIAILMGGLAVVILASTRIQPAPAADQMAEVHGRLVDLAPYGQGTGRRADFQIAHRTETFWTDRGYSLLVIGSDVRFFAQADGPGLRRALNGSVHAYAISVDGKEIETLQAALRRSRNDQLILVGLALVMGALAILVIATSVKKWRAENLEALESMPGSERRPPA